MRKICSLLLLWLLVVGACPVRASGVAARAQDAAKSVQASEGGAAPLSNADVVALVGAKLAPEIIVAKIRESRSSFDTSPAALAKLKESGVPDAVLLAMVLAAGGGAAGGSASTNASQPAGSGQPSALKVKIPAGLIVDVETAYDVSSQEVKDGEAISFRVVYPVKVEGLTVIEPGAVASGRIVKSRRGGHFGKAGTLIWQLQDVTAVDGSRIPLEFATRMRGDSKAAKVAAQTALTGVLLGPFAPLALMHGFKRGENAFIPAGKRFTGFIQKGAEVSVGRASQR